VTAGALAAIERSRRAVETALAGGRPIYGITTGFGRLSEVAIPKDQLRQLQLNLILSHAAGVGPELPRDAVRAAVLLRANALCRGHSGVRPELVDALVGLLNHDVTPVVPGQGSLGASGDLAPLAHIALVLIGRGEAWHGGRRLAGAEALRAAGLRPLALEAKEGLALINGTQVMTGIAALALADALQLLDAANCAAALTMEALGGLRDALDPRLHAARGQPGQAQAAAAILELLAGSALTFGHGEGRVQDAYSLRCAPQVHGAAHDALSYAAAAVGRELNATTDNPLIFATSEPGAGELDAASLSGGNFHGQPVAIAADLAAIALSALANISERRIERMVNPDLSGLPAFLTRHSGLESGYMIAQYTAAALASENKILASPASVDTIPSSANQEDHVSMGTIAARKLARVVEQTRQVVAIELMCAAQALELRLEQCGLPPAPAGLGRGTAAAYAAVRSRVRPLDSDRELAPDMAALADLIAAGGLPQ
jgi:histidine ammonia-lyase